MIGFVPSGQHLFRFLDHRSKHFWSSLDDILVRQKLFLNSRTKFNDPFDSRPLIKDDLRHTDIRGYFDAMTQDPFWGRSATNALRILEIKSKGQSITKDRINRIRAGAFDLARQHLDNCGLLSFSLNAEDPLLWGHYAASFEGISLVFRRTNAPRSAFSICAKVEYVDEPPTLPLSLMMELARRWVAKESNKDVANEVFFLSFLHKDSRWSHENEARVFYPKSAFEKISFDPQELLAIILGPKSSSDLETRIRTEVASKRPSLSIHKAILSPNHFKIILPHQFIRRSKLAA
jgi:hypothetical protein